ncbi:Tetratricopeptide repeat-containing protein [Parapedobacter composti]|uniref:histidine kinase n=1 Tax=Parapedobacter composti TaxID=623281 RepID=A0A1I1LL08_9SPHI|nr:tetratricopeptide repeat-containing sensor histidine kinase [Parapedobacter composti]SFC73719.1 Tetratricopeptide repeat-containing protein [Parapedobacter composti]
MKSLNCCIFLATFLACTSKKGEEKAAIRNPYYDSAFEYLDEGKTDSAFLAFDMAKDLFIEANDSLNAANCLIQMAITQTDQHDYFGGQETSLQAMEYLNANNPKHHVYLSSNFNNLGIATYSLKDYDRALNFYDAAIKYSNDSSATQVYQNNKAKVYHDRGEYDSAISILERALKQVGPNKREHARILTNLTLARWRQHPDNDVAADFLKALHIRERENDWWGQNSSYTHLSDYYAPVQPDSALFYARKLYDVARRVNSADDQIRALYRLIKLSPSDSIQRYFERYTALKDSVALVRAAAKNQFALIRYEVEKNKAANLKLQKENAEKAYQISRQRILTAIVAIAAIALLAGGMYWHRKRKQRLELEVQNQIKAHQLKTSKKVHDVVANGLYRVMAEIENKNDIDREGILDRLEAMYEKSRDISYDTETNGLSANQQNFNDKITDLLTSFASDATKVIIAGNNSGLWANVTPEARHEVEHILQELMVNMKKHSRASHVAVRFERVGHELHIHYSDNGIGLPKPFTYRNGLTNTGNRIKNLRGLITFDTEVEKGLKIHLSFPVS